MQKVEFAAAATELGILEKGEEFRGSQKRNSVAKGRPAARYRAAAGCRQAPAAFNLAAEFFGGIMHGGTPRVRPAIENRGDQAAGRGSAVSLRFGIL